MLVRVRCVVISGIFLLAGCSASGAAIAISLEKGDSRDPISGQFHDGAIASALLAAQFYGMSGFATMDEGGSYYALLGATLARYDMNTSTVVGSWPLTRWESQYYHAEIVERFDENYLGDYPRGEYSVQSLSAPGCLQHSPLRYGSTHTGGDSSIVLFLGNNFVLFSPSAGKIIFAEKYHLDEWLTADASEKEYRNKPHVPESSRPYYSLSSVMADGRYPNELPGYRGYSKLFFGDIDDSDARDIIVWRKLYVSRTMDVVPAGFDLVRNEWRHYQQIADGDAAGEFVLQETPEATIRSWLTANDLTWQSGYPTYSECPGAEGQLIPEMHDPLLNDPDVLQ